MSISFHRSQPITGRSGQVPWTRGNRVVGWDPVLHRMWVGGQRLHHGATGLALATAGMLGMSRRRRPHRRALAWALAGGVLAAHDWKDHAAWFRGGPQAS